MNFIDNMVESLSHKFFNRKKNESRPDGKSSNISDEHEFPLRNVVKIAVFKILNALSPNQIYINSIDA